MRRRREKKRRKREVGRLVCYPRLNSPCVSVHTHIALSSTFPFLPLSPNPRQHPSSSLPTDAATLKKGTTIKCQLLPQSSTFNMKNMASFQSTPSPSGYPTNTSRRTIITPITMPIHQNASTIIISYLLQNNLSRTCSPTSSRP